MQKLRHVRCAIRVRHVWRPHETLSFSAFPLFDIFRCFGCQKERRAYDPAN